MSKTNNLAYLWCSQNNIYCLPKLPQSPGTYEYRDIIVDEKVHCIPNKTIHRIFTLTDEEYSYENILPLCSPINNVNNCEAFPVIAGSVFYDNNSNGIKDSEEKYKVNIPVRLSDGQVTYSNNNGYFELGADTGNYNITLTPPIFYSSSANNYNFHFTTYDTLIYQLIALQPIAVVDSILINIHHINWAARPGFSYPYLIQYDNIGTTTLSPNIIFNYDGNLLTYDSCSNSSVVHSVNTLTLSQNNFVPGEHRSFIAYFTIKTTAPLEDTLHATVTVTAGNASTTDKDFILIGGSFDPNDKQATPELTPQQVTEGKYINYTIRFQNTGTDTAFTVVIADTLSSSLQLGTLEMLNTSHLCNTTITGNKIYFEFLNILLPDSNVNEPASHGFVSFRIKPKSSVTEGTTITNKASIYFDYNLPVVTNTATTLIQDPVISIQTYIFTGNGNWSNAANWSNNIIPPSTISNGAQIIIDPAGNGECVLDVPQVVGTGSIFTIKAGKRFRVTGNLIMQ